MSSICIFSALCPPSMGGVERFTDGLAAELAAEGHRVVVVTNNTHALASSEVLENGVEVLRLPCMNLLGGRYPLPVRDSRYRELMGRLDAFAFDGVLINTRFYIHSLIGVGFAARQGLRPVVLDHGSAYLTLGSKPLDRVIERYEDAMTAHLRRRGVDFYGISQKSAEWLSHFGIEAKGVIGNSIDAAAYRARSSARSFRAELGICDGGLLVAFTGRFVPEKGIETLLAMMRELEDAPIHLVMAGSGPLRSRIEEAALPNVHVVGRLDVGDIAALLLESDLFCLPTRSEGFSTSLLEASACATPSLITDVGGAAELIPDPSYGFIEHKADPHAFADLLRRCARGEFDLRAMGDACQRRVEDTCSWSSCAAQVISACCTRSRPQP